MKRNPAAWSNAWLASLPDAELQEMKQRFDATTPITSLGRSRAARIIREWEMRNCKFRPANRGPKAADDKQSVVRDSPAQRKASQSEISRVMSALGKRGGKIGGRKRAESLSPTRRTEIALKAATARWQKQCP